MKLELSLTKEFADLAGFPLSKTANTEPDISHWYGKLITYKRKKYVIFTNTMTRFCVLYRYNKKTLVPDFYDALAAEFQKYGLDFSKIPLNYFELTVGNSKKATAQLNRCAMEIEWVLERIGIEEESDPLADFNKGNLGTAGRSGMVFALDEMKKFF